MGTKITELVIMFADIAGSTQLYEKLGDTVARQKVASTLQLISDVVERYQGTVIKTIGDEVMCTFKKAEEAVTAGCEMHEELQEDATEGACGNTPVAIRIGLHFGSAIMEGGDVFGDAVNVAARMTAQAKANQIITTQETIETLSPILRASTRFVDRAPIKGKKETVDIFEVIWQQDDVTRMATGILAMRVAEPTKMGLNYNGQLIDIDENRSEIVLGRSVTCDLTINEKLASRQHVKIQLRRGKFFIIDQSTNGTYFMEDGKSQVFVRREELPITGTGIISLGRPFDEDPLDVVLFRMKT